MAYVLPLLVIGAILFVAFLGSRVERSWLSPSIFFCLLWSGYLLASLPNVADPEYLLEGYLWVAISCFVVVAGGCTTHLLTPRTIGIQAHASSEARCKQILDSLLGLRSIVRVLVLMGIAEILILFARRGFSASAIFSLNSMSQVSASNRLDFGYGDLQQSRLEWFILMFTYLNAFLGGLLFRLERGWVQRFNRGILPMLLVVYIGILYGSRMGVLFGGSFWLAAYLAGDVIVTGTDRRHEMKLITKFGFTAVGILVGLSIVAMAVRYKYLSHDQGFKYFLVETFSFLLAFCKWFSVEDIFSIEPLYGFRTFWKLYEACGVVENPEPVIDVENTTSNIYTMFRGLIEDWGPLGSCLWLFVFGMIASRVYHASMSGRLRSVPALAMIYAYIFVGTCFSLFTYNVTNVSLAILGMYALFLPEYLPAVPVLGKQHSSVRLPVPAPHRQPLPSLGRPRSVPSANRRPLRNER